MSERKKVKKMNQLLVERNREKRIPEERKIMKKKKRMKKKKQKKGRNE